MDSNEHMVEDLWEELENISRMFNLKIFFNLEREFEWLAFEKVKYWEGHLQNFHEIKEKIAEYEPMSIYT